MLSVASERPIDPRAVEILRQVDRVARDLEIEYFVTGATARDILLDGVFGLDTGRATRDVDLALALHGWLQFEAVKRRLVETGAFAPDEGVVHRLLHLTGSGQRGYPVDLIPFGPIEEPANEIAWPPDRSIVMNVAGYREAFDAARAVEIQPGFVIRVASLPGLVVLKLLAWADRGPEDPRDAIDLGILLRRYGDAGNEDRLYGAELEVLEAVNHNVDLASPRLLGRDVARMAPPETRARILTLLADALRLDRLIRDVARAMPGTEDSLAMASALLTQFKAGLQENIS
jgi:predicted nucleotidyltransferase